MAISGAEQGLSGVERERPLVFLIVEDVPAWREHIRKKLIRLFGPDTIVLEAKDSPEAIAILAEHDPDFITLDLHLNPAVDTFNDELNAEGLVRHLMETQRPVRIGVASMSNTEEVQRELRDRFGFVLLPKRSFALGTEREERELLQVLEQELAAEPKPIEESEDNLTFLTTMKRRLANIPQARLLADRLVAIAADIHQRYKHRWEREMTGEADILAAPRLQDGEGEQLGLRIHDFKNDLPDFIAKVHNIVATKHATDLFLELNLFLSYVEEMYANLNHRGSSEVDFAQLVRNACALVNNAYTNRIRVNVVVPDGRVFIPVKDKFAMIDTFFELLRNALQHSISMDSRMPDECISVILKEDGTLSIWNTGEQNLDGKFIQLPFCVEANQIREGALQAAQQTASPARGVAQAIASAAQNGFSLSIKGDDDIHNVQTRLRPPAEVRFVPVEDAKIVGTRDLSGVVFLDKERGDAFGVSCRSAGFTKLPFNSLRHGDRRSDLYEQRIGSRSDVFHGQLGKARILVGHFGWTQSSDALAFLEAMRRAYTHLVVYPVSSCSGGFEKLFREDDGKGDLSPHAANVLTYQQIVKFIAPEDTCHLAEIQSKLYQSEPDPDRPRRGEEPLSEDAWNALHSAAIRMSEDLEKSRNDTNDQ